MHFLFVQPEVRASALTWTWNKVCAYALCKQLRKAQIQRRGVYVEGEVRTENPNLFLLLAISNHTCIVVPSAINQIIFSLWHIEVCSFKPCLIMMMMIIDNSNSAVSSSNECVWAFTLCFFKNCDRIVRKWTLKLGFCPGKQHQKGSILCFWK